MERVILGLSGGVDSAESALRLRAAGFEVFGVWLDMGFGSPEAARRAAQQLRIPFSVFDAAQAHETLVRRPFAESYCAGRTPNPCARCNPLVKLPSLAAAADAFDARWIATGHYAAVAREGERICLRESGGAKDQSYMLAMVPQALLGRLLLPLTGTEKTTVRTAAAAAGLSAAQEKDSQDICFVPDGDYGSFLERQGLGYPPGDFTDLDGNWLGTHRGLHRYTVGQRRGLGVSAAQRFYVHSLLPDTNTVRLCFEPELLTNETHIRSLNWVSIPQRSEAFRALVKLRSRPSKQAARLTPESGGWRIDFDAPVRRPAPGQLAVAYDEAGRVLCGGEIQ